MAARSYDALVLDVDGTLLGDDERVHPRTLQALLRARAAGVVVMLATGRAHGSTRGLMRELGLDSPALVYNGAALYCPSEDRLIERRVLADQLVDELHALTTPRDLLTVVEHGDERYARAARSSHEASLLAWLGCVLRPLEPLALGQTVRFTIFSEQHHDSLALHDEVRNVVSQPAYYTHFGLAMLAGFRNSNVQGLDVHPVCEGKAEVFRVLQARFGIPSARVVAVGDADNDLPMLSGAGLGVAMGNATEEAKRAARRVIGDNCSDALATLIEELFL
ncbi:MAG TPA: HAD family hydrolase, partial [Polyangiales bacterium]|nr:HAD family hydrolase [Polyangiales bacterium]